ncbi:MAG: hypothetical protein EOO16_13220 [Chitinophagaceae bacterium]|nr:MAG: hypothetical protein EOO16_13220 [Chitinophagaceae bacterium]
MKSPYTEKAITSLEEFKELAQRHDDRVQIRFPRALPADHHFYSYMEVPASAIFKFWEEYKISSLLVFWNENLPASGLLFVDGWIPRNQSPCTK